jgi:hypothetical protein
MTLHVFRRLVPIAMTVGANGRQLLVCMASATLAACLVAPKAGTDAKASREPRVEEPPPELTRIEVVTRDADSTAGAKGAVRLTGRLANGERPTAILRRDGRELSRTESSTANFDVPIVAPGDYELAIEDRGHTLARRRVFARAVSCAGGTHRLLVREAGSPTLRYRQAQIALRVPRWVAKDFDASFIVDWIYDGKKARNAWPGRRLRRGRLPERV